MINQRFTQFSICLILSQSAFAQSVSSKVADCHKSRDTAVDKCNPDYVKAGQLVLKGTTSPREYPQKSTEYATRILNACSRNIDICMDLCKPGNRILVRELSTAELRCKNLRKIELPQIETLAMAKIEPINPIAFGEKPFNLTNGIEGMKEHRQFVGKDRLPIPEDNPPPSAPFVQNILPTSGPIPGASTR